VKKILWTGLLAGFLMAVGNVLMNIVYSWIFPGINDIYAGISSFRPMDDPLMALFWLYPLALGLGLSWVWRYTSSIFKKDSTFMAGLKFGVAYIVVAGIPTFLINYSSFNFPFVIIFSWFDMSSLNGLIAGWTLAKWAR